MTRKEAEAWAKRICMGPKTYSKDWCQGFCTLCGTACAEHCEMIHELGVQYEKLEAKYLGLRQALEAIAAKGEASPGDKKAAMAKAALHTEKDCADE